MLCRARVDWQPNLKCSRRSEHRNRAGVWIRHPSEPLVPRSDRAGRALLQTSGLSFSAVVVVAPDGTTFFTIDECGGVAGDVERVEPSDDNSC
jgi:hypothetical protein